MFISLLLKWLNLNNGFVIDIIIFHMIWDFLPIINFQKITLILIVTLQYNVINEVSFVLFIEHLFVGVVLILGFICSRIHIVGPVYGPI